MGRSSGDRRGISAEQEFDLVWRTVKGRWKVTVAEYHGREFTPVAYRDRDREERQGRSHRGALRRARDYGFLHDIVVQQGNRLLTQTAFNIEMTAKLAQDKVCSARPSRSRFRASAGASSRGSWVLLYDNKFTGFMSAVTTGGTVRFTLTATGHVGHHIIEIQHSDFGSPYRNTQQSPVPDRPCSSSPSRLRPAHRCCRRRPSAGADRGAFAAAARRSGRDPGVRRRRATGRGRGGGFEPGKTHQLNWNTVVGNRMTGRGWEEVSRVIAQATADATGSAEFRFNTPDDLGGVHTLWVATGNSKKQGAFWIAPTALPLDVMRGPVGTTFRIHLKGVGWSETANIYTVVYDNATSGYACAFNSQGDIEIFMQATGEPGWHFIDLYPAIYKGKETRPNNYRLAQLTYADDHPGEDLPRFRFAFEVTPPIVQ